jgi:SAM-dependent methyltransferase
MWSNLQIERAARRWDRNWADNTNFNWWNVPEIVLQYNEKIAGRPIAGDSAGCRERLRQRWPNRRFERAVSIGCGMAHKEVALVEEDCVQHFELYDISQHSIAEARQEITKRRLANRFSFLKSDPIEDWSSRYDLVYWDHALHHVFNVDRYVAWSQSVLCEDGVFLLNDYVGPNRLQFSDFNVRMCRSLIDDLDHDRSVPPIRRSSLLTRLRQYLSDPSEAADSENILPSCRRHFANLEFKPIGGFIYNLLGNRLRHFVGNPKAIDAILQLDNKLHDQYYHYAFVLWQKQLT